MSRVTHLVARFRAVLRAVVRRKYVEQELDEEIQYHLGRQIDEALKTGASAEEARYAALRAMGAIDKSKEESRDVRRADLVSGFLGDLRYGGRALRRSPGFAILAIGIMAVGIGANTAVFSVVNGVLLRSLPYPNAERIVVLRTAFLTTGETQTLIAIGNFRDWRDYSSTFSAMSSYRPGETSVNIGATAEYVRIASVDGQFFRVLGVDPVIGRTFRPEEAGPGGPPYVIISHAFWQTRLGGDPRVLERSIHVNNVSRSIIGVLPPGFQFPGQTDVWGPQTTQSTSRTGHNFYAIGRLKPGVSLEQAQADLTTVAAALEQQYPNSNKGRGVTATRLHDELVGNVRLTLYLLWGVVGVVLLIACANTATLLLSRAMGRMPEVGVRVALGASRFRIVRQLISESLLLALVAGAAGTLLAHWGSKVLVAIVPFDAVRSAQPGIDGGVLVFTLAVSLATSVLFGLVPAVHASRTDVIDALKQAGSRSVMGGRAMRTRSVLVVSEIALAVVLLAGAGVLMKTLMALQRVELGFQPANVLVMKATGVRTIEENNAFFREFFSRVSALPGVVAVGATSIPPGDLSLAGSGSYFVDRMPERRDGSVEPQALMSVVAPGSFAALGIPLKSGRDFTDGDSVDRPLVAIVNEALVRESFAGQDPIGRGIFCNFDRGDAMMIVGVVGDVRQRNPAIDPMPECYMPYRQHAYNGNTLNVLIRTAGDPTTLVGTVRRLAAETSPAVPVSFTTMDAILSEGVEEPRFRAMLFGLFAVLAVCLAMAGVYGVMAYSVQQRSSEMGLRIALGADKKSVLQMVLGQGLVLAFAGLVLGLAGAVAATRLLTTVLFQVQPVDMQVFLAVIALLGAVTLVAAYIPARRAAIVDPVAVLKAS